MSREVCKFVGRFGVFSEMNRLQVFRKIMKYKHVITQAKAFSTFEPEYLQSASSSNVGIYDTLNIQIKGYDFPILESFQKFVHKTAEAMGIEVEDGWATPAQKLSAKKFKKNSAVIDSEYNLTVYERNVQIVDVPSTVGAIFFDVLHEALPEGVKLRIHEHLEEHEEIRYVPDMELIELKSQLETMGGPTKKKNR